MKPTAGAARNICLLIFITASKFLTHRFKLFSENCHFIFGATQKLDRVINFLVTPGIKRAIYLPVKSVKVLSVCFLNEFTSFNSYNG